MHYVNRETVKLVVINKCRVIPVENSPAACAVRTLPALFRVCILIHNTKLKLMCSLCGASCVTAAVTLTTVGPLAARTPLAACSHQAALVLFPFFFLFFLCVCLGEKWKFAKMKEQISSQLIYI